MRKTLEQHFEVVVFDKIPFECPIWLRIYHQFYKRFSSKLHQLQFEPAILKNAARRIEKKFYETKCDAVFCPGSGTPVNTFISGSIPVFSYLDASKLTWIKTYFGIHSLCRRSQRILYKINESGLKNARLTFFSSDWAREEALKEVQVNEGKFVEIPFGANLLKAPEEAEARQFAEDRLKGKPQFLFLGKEWIRKGGDTAFKLINILRNTGIDAELHVIGCNPGLSELPAWVITHGYIDRSSIKGQLKFNEILARSYFLLFFSTAEAYGLALCEANAFAVPCIAANTGGIPAIIHPGKNGYLFNGPFRVEEIADCILQLLRNPEQYRLLALQSKKEYEERLNWERAGTALATVMRQQLSIN